MRESIDSVHRAYEAAQTLLGKLTRNETDPSKPLISVDQLFGLVQAEAGVQITAVAVLFEATYLRGRVERYGPNGREVRIHIRATLEYDMARFVSAKEAMHPLVDQDVDLSPCGDETLDELISQGHFGLLSLSPSGNGPVQSEVMAEIAALETLYPLDCRKGDIERLLTVETVLKIAERYAIPSSYVATALDPRYLRKVGEQNAIDMAASMDEWNKQRLEDRRRRLMAAAR